MSTNQEMVITAVAMAAGCTGPMTGLNQCRNPIEREREKSRRKHRQLRFQMTTKAKKPQPQAYTRPTGGNETTNLSPFSSTVAVLSGGCPGQRSRGSTFIYRLDGLANVGTCGVYQMLTAHALSANRPKAQTPPTSVLDLELLRCLMPHRPSIATRFELAARSNAHLVGRVV